MERFKNLITPTVLSGEYNGDSVDFTLILNEPINARAITAIPVFDSKRFTLTDGDWSIDGSLSDFSADEGNGVIAFIDRTEVRDTVLRFSLKPTAATASVERFAIRLIINDGSSNVDIIEATFAVDMSK